MFKICFWANPSQDLVIEVLKSIQNFCPVFPLIKNYINRLCLHQFLGAKAQYFYSFKASYNVLYEASQMFCFDYNVL
jgi:hypothetical protein